MDQIPDYMLRRPALTYTNADRAEFDRLLTAAIQEGTVIDYKLSMPCWQFLCYLADEKGLLLHGSGNPEIGEFEPRRNTDVNPFGAQTAVYAASDGIWPMYYAILDRGHYPMTLHNACVRVASDEGWSSPLYFFSITETARAQQPWRSGTVYVLPSDDFIPHPEQQFQGVVIQIPMWACPKPVRPLAAVRVEPRDFPFLTEIRGHDDARLFARASADPDGFPWLDD